MKVIKVWVKRAKGSVLRLIHVAYVAKEKKLIQLNEQHARPGSIKDVQEFVVS